MLLHILTAAAVATELGQMSWTEVPGLSRDCAKILVTRFEGPEAYSLRVSEWVEACLEQELGSCDFIEVELYDGVAAYYDAAVDAGSKTGALLVIYGSFSVAEDQDLMVNLRCGLAAGAEGTGRSMPETEYLLNLDSGHLLDDIIEQGSAQSGDWPFPPYLVAFCDGVLGNAALYMGGRYENAIGWLGSCIDYNDGQSTDPAQLEQMIYFYAVSMLNEGRYEESLPGFGRCIEMDPENYEYYYNRGVAYYQMDDFIHALADFNRTIELNPDYPTVYFTRGYTRCQTGAREAGIQDLTKAIELNPSDSRFFTERGRAYSDLGQFDLAVGDLTAALELDPYNPIPLLLMSVARYETGDYDEALAVVDRLDSLGIEHPNMHTIRGNCFDMWGRYDEAVEQFTAAIGLDPYNLFLYFLRGTAYYSLGRVEEARADLELVVQYSTDPEQVEEATRMLERM